MDLDELGFMTLWGEELKEEIDFGRLRNPAFQAGYFVWASPGSGADSAVEEFVRREVGHELSGKCIAIVAPGRLDWLGREVSEDAAVDLVVVLQVEDLFDLLTSDAEVPPESPLWPVTTAWKAGRAIAVSELPPEIWEEDPRAPKIGGAVGWSDYWTRWSRIHLDPWLPRPQGAIKKTCRRIVEESPWRRLVDADYLNPERLGGHPALLEGYWRWLRERLQATEEATEEVTAESLAAFREAAQRAVFHEVVPNLVRSQLKRLRRWRDDGTALTESPNRQLAGRALKVLRFLVGLAEPGLEAQGDDLWMFPEVELLENLGLVRISDVEVQLASPVFELPLRRWLESEPAVSGVSKPPAPAAAAGTGLKTRTRRVEGGWVLDLLTEESSGLVEVDLKNSGQLVELVDLLLEAHAKGDGWIHINTLCERTGRQQGAVEGRVNRLRQMIGEALIKPPTDVLERSNSRYRFRVR